MMLRIDQNHLLIQTDQGDIELFANPEVLVDRKSVDEIIAFAQVHDTVDKLRAVGFLDSDARIERIILTPDFHKGAGIPIGTVFRARGLVMPRAVGSDIGCGMRFMMTDVTREEFASLGDRLDHILRHIFFEGGRNIALSRFQREMIFQEGLLGLCETPHAGGGIWPYWDASNQYRDAELTHGMGGFSTGSIFEMADFIRGSGGEFTHDDQIGSIGGGNHFCEFQVVEEIFDRHLAYFWQIPKDRIAIMVHSGSVGIGHQVGNHFTDQARAMYPEGLRHNHDFYMIPEERADTYLGAMANAANFAIVNRLFLGLMMVRSLSEALGRKITYQVVYDAPHNLIWREEGFVHRKGACPADHDEPVLVPGSMGSSSYVMAGRGHTGSFCSACHGAGRAHARQASRRKLPESFPCRVVTKLDTRECSS